MSEERITERTDASGNVTERVIERGTPGTTVIERRNGGGGVVIGLIIVFALGILAFFLFDINKSEAVKDDAITQAVGKAGDGAQKVGDAADRVADKLTGEKK